MWWSLSADHSFLRILIYCSQSTEFTHTKNLLRSGWESNYLFTDQLTVKSLTREWYFATVSQSGWAGGEGGGQRRGEDQLEGSVALTRCEDKPGKVLLVWISFWPVKMIKKSIAVTRGLHLQSVHYLNLAFDARATLLIHLLLTDWNILIVMMMTIMILMRLIINLWHGFSDGVSSHASVEPLVQPGDILQVLWSLITVGDRNR